jgi:Tol biopolymer transport system component
MLDRKGIFVLFCLVSAMEVAAASVAGLFAEGQPIATAEATDYFGGPTVDFDGDGRTDLILSTGTYPRGWYRNLGGAFDAFQSLKAPETYRVAGDAAQTLHDIEQDSATDPQFADLDGDGDLEILMRARRAGAAAGEQKRILVQENTGTPQLPVPVDWTERLIANAWEISTPFVGVEAYTPVDIDDDGDLDIAAALVSSNRLAFAWIAQQENGDFASGGLIADFGEQAVDADSAVLSSADLDGDGDADLLAAFDRWNADTERFEPRSLWFENRGAATWPAYQLPGGFRHAADLDDDGLTDLITRGGACADALGWTRNLGNGVFAGCQTINSAGYMHRANIADLDGDGDIDLAGTLVGTVASEQKPAWFENDGNGGFRLHALNVPGDAAFRSIALADVDSDGLADLLWGDQLAYATGHALQWHRNLGVDPAGNDMDGDGIADWQDTCPHVSDPLQRDVDGDGEGDVCDTAFSLPTPLILNLSGENNFAVGDLNNDGRSDLVYTVPLAWIAGSNEAAAQPSRPIGSGQDVLYLPQLVDVDDDGRVDIVGVDATGTSNVVWYRNAGPENPGNDDIAFESPRVVGSVYWRLGSSHPDAYLLHGDLDGDDDADLIFAFETLYQPFFNNGNGGFTTTASFTDSQVVPRFLSDIDRDGDLDLGCYHTLCAGTLLNDGKGQFGASMPQTGLPFDLDRDGQPDLIHLGSSVDQGVQSWRRGSTDGSYAPLEALTYSTRTGDQAVRSHPVLPGITRLLTDYDGDGRAETAFGAFEHDVDNRFLVKDPLAPDSAVDLPAFAYHQPLDWDGDGDQDVVISRSDLGVLLLRNGDRDADGVDDSLDNCLTQANPDQRDHDTDGSGDVCDLDDDNDGLADADELTEGLDPFNRDQDNDGVVDGREIAYGTDPTIADSDRDGILDGDEIRLGKDPNRADSAVFGNGLVTDSLARIDAGEVFADPVVILGVPSSFDVAPGVARIGSVTAGASTGFDVQFAEWRYLDGVHAAEEVPWLVVEAGHWSMPDGAVWEAGTFVRRNDTSASRIDFAQPFERTPRVFLTVQNDAGHQRLVALVGDVDTTGFSARLRTAEAVVADGGDVRVGYLAMATDSGDGSAPFPYRLQNALLDHAWTEVAGQQLRLQEEQSADAEMALDAETTELLWIGHLPFLQSMGSANTDAHSPRRELPGIERVSVRSDGGESAGIGIGNPYEPNGNAALVNLWPEISDDGRLIVFHSAADNLTDPSPPARLNVYLHDRATGETRLISRNAKGEPGNRNSVLPAISGDGRVIAFWSQASNLSAVDSDDYGCFYWDLFVYDRIAGQMERVPLCLWDGAYELTPPQAPSLSDDGRFIAYPTLASDYWRVHVFDRLVGETRAIENNWQPPAGNPNTRPLSQNHHDHDISISGDGQFVVFLTTTYNVDTDIVARGYRVDAYLQRLGSGETWRLSESPDGKDADAGSRSVALSDDGLHVAFCSFASNLRSDDAFGWKQFVRRDLLDQGFQQAPVVVDALCDDYVSGGGSAPAAGLTGDGRRLVHSDHISHDGDTIPGVQVYLTDLDSGTSQLISRSLTGEPSDAASRRPVVSKDGRYVAFQSEADDLVPGDTNGISDIFVARTWVDVADDPDRDGVPSATDNCASEGNPAQANTDSDADGDACDLDDDNDGWEDTFDNCPKTPNPDQAQHDSDLFGDACDDDDDGDGMPDRYEQTNGLDQLNAADAGLDGDGDGLSNLAESRLGTRADNPDTDGDGTDDGIEVSSGRNPLFDEGASINVIIQVILSDG